MDYIDSGKRHALITVETRGERGSGKTWCGKDLTGQTGGCVAALIDCKTCKAAMRREGWQV